MEVSAVRSAVLRDRNLSSTESSGSKGPLWSPARTIERSQEGTRGGLEGFILLAPFRNLKMRSCFPRDRPSTASWWAAIAATYTFKVEGDSLRSNLSCRKESTTPIVHLRGSSRWEEHQVANRLHFSVLVCLVEGALAWMMVSTTAGGRPLKSATSRPGATHGGSIDLDAGAIWCRAPWERRSFLRGMRQGGTVAREMSSGNQVRVGQWGATSRICSSSSLSLHSVCASRLTGGNAYLRKARGQLCASASVPRGPSVREKYSWQWEDSGEANRSTWASPNRLQISRIVSGWSRHSPGNVSCRESASAARLSCPGMWTARSDLNCVWLQRRRWRASCDMRCDRIPPSRLIYETAAVLSVRTSTCLPNSSGRNCRKAKCTAHSSRQLMCQSSRGPVQSPEAACPLHVAPQPVLEASLVTTVCRDTCSRGTPARRKARSVQGLRERRHCWEIPTRSVPRRHAHLGTRECSQCWSGLIWSNPSGVTAAADAICPRSLWNCFSGTTFLPLKELRQFSTAWARSSVRRAVISPSLTPHREKRFSAQGRACSFPSWPEAPTGWGAGAPSPFDRPTALWIGLE